MAHLDNRRINFVKGLSIDARARVLYEFLNKGTSNREIERRVQELAEEDGWQAWSVIHFYGFDKNHKARYTAKLKEIREQVEDLNEDEIAELHFAYETDKLDFKQINMNEIDGQDVFRLVKQRNGQHKLRKTLLRNYNSKCALCNITNSNLLAASHINTWSESNQQDRIDPRNAILLCKLHDAMFEHGIISLAKNYEVIYSPKFDFNSQGIATNLIFTPPMIQPPAQQFLTDHRMKHSL